MSGAASIRALAFFGGGTGGHLFPGIAVAERARERFGNCRIVFFRTGRAVEDRVLQGRGFEVQALPVAAPGKLPSGWLRYWREVRAARRDSAELLRTPGWVAFGLGGYASLPGVLAARKAGAPVLLLEQNRIPGKVNRLLAPVAGAVCCSYPETRLSLCRRRVVTGNPVRRAVLDAARRPPRERPGDRRTVLIVGGSQGARGINRAVAGALEELRGLSGKIDWIHLAGDADKENMTEAYRTHGWQAEVLAYSDELPELMARSDLVLSRAGGTTLAELAVIGRPSVLVPYPHHKDQHQLANARSLLECGGARLIEEPELNAESLRRVFEDVLFDPATLDAMGRSARSLARPDAADAVLDLAMDLSAPCPSASGSSC